ncbi:hemerythrin domain-containing protein [Chryseolinea sp. H1M3-3]|uniref:hemerythrin domain-containing protein n=1 Tax=Chryseolinea sp. H1M3-3 TaxID=3034144 RepID=UPI0023EA8C59|nr:hemerythrin domain-containing protein [Chryseolinea sp. H1M3-3]
MHKPIKRHDSLKPVSRDHHHGLLFCWKIREGFKRKIQPDRIRNYADWFWETHLTPHFAIEEHHVFPVLGNNHELVKKALAEHRRLKRLFESETEDAVALGLIEEELEKHIRFEERQLFNEIQEVATPEQLAEIEKHHNEPAAGENWQDEFWK